MYYNLKDLEPEWGGRVLKPLKGIGPTERSQMIQYIGYVLADFHLPFHSSEGKTLGAIEYPEHSIAIAFPLIQDDAIELVIRTCLASKFPDKVIQFEFYTRIEGISTLRDSDPGIEEFLCLAAVDTILEGWEKKVKGAWNGKES
jgi:hypothetical protein